MFASLFVLLYVGHLVADYPLQTDHMARHKADRSAVGWAAAAEHAACHLTVCLLLVWGGTAALHLNPNPIVLGTALLWLGASHLVIDRRWPIAWWMTRAKQAGYAKAGGSAQVDQVAHIALGLLPAALLLASVR